MEQFFQIGVISSTHGLKGEVKVYPTTEDPKRFEVIRDVILDTGKEQINLEIERVKYFKQFVIVKFRGIDDINDIEKYKGRSLLVTRENATPLEEGEFYVADLIGLEVVTEDGSSYGHLVDVMETGANDVYVIERSDGKEILVPAIKQCILDTDIDKGIMKIHLLEGLED
ncbi:ribosome maturation factor RimM [Murimonas intestini]|mgnify:CR=1 FL=1|uniref:Ribosome maturation factor RimM n=1 Tax=Murimonas intestini TaxID=1337051 RepID=A0AB73T5A5_9FIRM|nr:ribosome maturation factor RimM [Murimonas intestini]MCR1840816.1 ribosome maturation factor RimM [Murimonas intestini]MCR1865133.1 ribosome maturation factor RimM [Murimonas intestini]MCR1883156.1 ribosome maturation factor RimM [Murimonas intestini]